jgi:hypothetical protein
MQIGSAVLANTRAMTECEGANFRRSGYTSVVKPPQTKILATTLRKYLRSPSLLAYRDIAAKHVKKTIEAAIGAMFSTTQVRKENSDTAVANP